MAKNKLKDLNDHLYAQLERLGDEELTGEALQAEIQRGKTIASLGAQIVGVGRLVLDAEEMRRERPGSNDPLLALTKSTEEA